MNQFDDFSQQLAKVKPISYWSSGEAAFLALKKTVNELASSAPKDNDVIIEAFNLTVREVRYIEPHTLVFNGFDEQGNNSFVVCHFSQLLARVIYKPKAKTERIITGFSTITS